MYTVILANLFIMSIFSDCQLPFLSNLADYVNLLGPILFMDITGSFSTILPDDEVDIVNICDGYGSTFPRGEIK